VASAATDLKSQNAVAVGSNAMILIQASPCRLLTASRLAQGSCATAQEEDRCDSTTASTVTIAESISP
jgi:hypothetical protein